MKAIWNGEVIAKSNDTVIIEGNHYFPADAIKNEFFTETDHHTTCPWKGIASYYTVQVNGEKNENSAWVYTEPKDAAKTIKNRVAFWKGIEVTE